MGEFRVGCAIFREQVPLSHFRRLFTKEVRAIMEKEDQWWLCLGIYKENWSIIFSLMRETYVLKLELGTLQPTQGEMSIAAWSKMCKEWHSHFYAHCALVLFCLLRKKSHQQSGSFAAHRGSLLGMALLWYRNSHTEENYLTDLRSLRKVDLRHLKVLNLSTFSTRQRPTRSENSTWEHCTHHSWANWQSRRPFDAIQLPHG